MNISHDIDRGLVNIQTRPAMSGGSGRNQKVKTSFPPVKLISRNAALAIWEMDIPVVAVGAGETC